MLVHQVEQVEQRVRDIEITCALRSQLGEIVADHETRLRTVEKLLPALRAVLWVGAGLGMSVIGFILALIIGQVQVIFP